MDDFASKLTGKIGARRAAATRPVDSPGREDVHDTSRNGASVDMVSPIEGSVSDINQTLVENPKLAVEQSLRRRLAGNCAGSRCQQSSATCSVARSPLVDRKSPRIAFRVRMPAAISLAGALAQDGGEAINGVTSQIPDAEWLPVAKEFFLS